MVTLHRDLESDSNEPPICYREINITKAFPSDIDAKGPGNSPNPSRQTDVSGLVSTDSPLTGNRKSVGLENAGFSKTDGATVSLDPGKPEYLNNGSLKDDISESKLDDSNVWTISDDHMQINNDKNNGNMSVEELIASSGRENNNLQSDSTNPKCLKTCLDIKDNRVKSTLRRHAARRLCSRIPAALMDQSTLDSLSKEDLLLMWKASEIEIYKKLDEVFKQTDRLKQTLEDYSVADT